MALQEPLGTEEHAVAQAAVTVPLAAVDAGPASIGLAHIEASGSGVWDVGLGSRVWGLASSV